jgi:hypothetical protein
VTIDQLSFSRPDPSSGVSTVPMIDNPQPDIVNVGVGLCPPLMGTFDYPPPTEMSITCRLSPTSLGPKFSNLVISHDVL